MYKKNSTTFALVSTQGLISRTKWTVLSQQKCQKYCWLLWHLLLLSICHTKYWQMSFRCHIILLMIYQYLKRWQMQTTEIRKRRRDNSEQCYKQSELHVHNTENTDYKHGKHVTCFHSFTVASLEIFSAAGSHNKMWIGTVYLQVKWQISFFLLAQPVMSTENMPVQQKLTVYLFVSTFNFPNPIPPCLISILSRY